MSSACGSGEISDPEARLSAEPPVLELGAVRVGGAARADLRLLSIAPRRVRLTSVEVVGALAEDVRVQVAPAELAPAAPGVVEVVFTPASFGSRLGVLAVRTAEGDALDVPVSGTGVPATLQLGPSALDFGRVPVGQSVQRVVSAQNVGEAPVRLVAITRDPGTSSEFEADLATQVTIAPGRASTFTVVYRPIDAGRDEGRLVLVDPDLDGALPVVEVRGEGLSSPLEVAPAALGFPSAVVGVPTRRPVRVSNVDSAAIELAPPRILGDGAAAYAVTPAEGWPRRLGPGEDLGLELTYLPTAPGEATAELRISAFGAAAPVVVPLEGLARRPVTPVARVEPAAVDFGPVERGRAHRAPLVLLDDGTVALEVRAARAQAPLAIVRALPEGARLEPGHWHAFDLELRAETLGAFTSTVVIETTDPARPTIEVPVRAEVVEGPRRRAVVWGPTRLGRVPRGETGLGRLELAALGGLGSVLEGARWLDDAGGRFFLPDGALPGPVALPPGGRKALELAFLDVAGQPAEHVGVLELTVDGAVQTVEVRASTVPPTAGPLGLEVELLWTSSASVDLLLVEGGGGPFDAPGVVSGCSPGPDWGAAGRADDDPRWSATPGRQVVELPAPAQAQYSVYVRHVAGPAADVTARARDADGRLGAVRARLSPGQLWPAGTLDLAQASFQPGRPPAASPDPRCY